MWNAGDGAKYSGLDRKKRNEAITSAIVADGVVDLSTGEMDGRFEKGVFQFCTKLETARLPESLRKIGDCTFYCCEALVRVDIPSGVNEIGKFAFISCESLQTVTIPEGIVGLPDEIFSGCTSLKSVKLPSSLKRIGESAFARCFSLSTINFDALKGVTKIDSWAFWKCSSLSVFKLPPKLQTIKRSTFEHCSSLSKVDFHDSSLKTMENGAFHNTGSLRIDLPESVRNIHLTALEGCRISLPTSLSPLTNDGDVKWLLHSVKDVVISARVNLGLLVDHISSLPDTYIYRGKRITFLDPNLTFKVLYSGGKSSTAALPPLKEHIPISFFSFEILLKDLTPLWRSNGGKCDDALLVKVESAFACRVRIYAALLRCKIAELPEEILHNLLPFIYGDVLTNAMIGDIVSAVKKIVPYN